MLRMTSAGNIPRAVLPREAASTAGSPSENDGEDLDHLTITILAAGKLARIRSSEDGSTQSLSGVPFLSAPGLRASTGT